MPPAKRDRGDLAPSRGQRRRGLAPSDNPRESDRGAAVRRRRGQASRTVVFCGTRGVPAGYGGFETAVDEISRRFVKNGYDCVVVCRRSSGGEAIETHEGRRLVYVEGSSSAKLDTFVSALETGWHLLRHRSDYGYVFWFNNANFPGILLTFLTRLPMSVNTDGMEWRRTKWAWPFKAYYFLASFLVARLCGSLISDSKAMRSFYKRVFRKDTECIPYGIPDIPSVPAERRSHILERYGLEAGRYFLQITRFEPDNLPLEAARAFRQAGLAKQGFKTLLVGYQRPTPYAQEIKALAGGGNVLVADAVYDPEVVATLRQNCFSYVHGNSVGGTNPALIEAMATCPRVLAIDVLFSREMLGETGYFFRPDDMAAAFHDVLGRADRSADMRLRVRSVYRWDDVAQSYMRLVEGRPADYPPFSGDRAL